MIYPVLAFAERIFPWNDQKFLKTGKAGRKFSYNALP